MGQKCIRNEEQTAKNKEMMKCGRKEQLRTQGHLPREGKKAMENEMVEMNEQYLVKGGKGRGSGQNGVQKKPEQCGNEPAECAFAVNDGQSESRGSG